VGGVAPVSALSGRAPLKPASLFTALGLFTFSVLLSAARGFAAGLTPFDEAWFLQVAHRVTSGEILYRDVFFGVTPLSIEFTALGVRLFGAEILVVKAAVGLCFALSVALAARIDAQLGGPRSFPTILVLALAALGRPEMAPYSGLSTVFLLATMSAALYWLGAARADVPDNRRAALALAAAGVAAGLSFASKQNLGAYAALALTASIAAGSRDRRAGLRALIIAGAACALAAGIALIPVWLDGAVEPLVRYGLLNKTTYVERAASTYLEEAVRRLALLPAGSWHERARAVYDLQRFAVPLLAAAALLAAWRRAARGERTTLTIVTSFVIAGFLGTLPKTDTEHLIHAMPLLIIGLMYGLRAAHFPERRWTRAGAAALLVWLGIGLTVVALAPIGQMASGNMRVSTLPHFRGVWIPAAMEDDLALRARRLSAAAAGEHPFLLIPEAGIYYLLTGLRNPTPYDYPYVTTFGPRGERDVIASIEQGRLTSVCFAARGPAALRPIEISRYVEERMARGEDAGACTLYRRRG
jgi:hypothetical protein